MNKRYSLVYQRVTVMEWLLGAGGRRPSEAAMEVTKFSAKKLRTVFTAILNGLENGQLERKHESGWKIIRKETK